MTTNLIEGLNLIHQLLIYCQVVTDDILGNNYLIFMGGRTLPAKQTFFLVVQRGKRFVQKQTYYTLFYQCSVAEWLRRWANLGVLTTTELLGGCGFESHSRHE